MPNITLYHGSDRIIQKPLFGYGRPYNDFGSGFYCTQAPELAKEWACTGDSDGYANCYELQTDGLNVLNLSDGYTILHWLALLTHYRKFQLRTPVMRAGYDYLEHFYLIDLSIYDTVIGYRADDSYFSFARAFLSNTISLSQLSFAMHLGKLGEQFVLKSKKAFGLIEFRSYEPADHTLYYPRRKQRNEEAVKSFRREMESSDISGLFMRDLIREEVKPDDMRLR